MIAVVMLSLSVASASDNVTDVVAIGDEITNDESLAVVEDAQIVSENESTVTSDNVVTKDNFKNYFDENGTLLENVTADVIIFSGNISDVGVDNIIVNRPITITGDNAIVTDIGFDVKSSDVLISGLTINQNKGEYAVSITNKNVTVEDLNINYNAKEGANGYAINADLADNLILINNIINYVGATTGWEVNNAVRVSSSNNTRIEGNKIYAKLIAADVGWAEVPPGSGNWVSSPISEGVVVLDSENAILSNNLINVTFNKVIGYYDTIYSVDVKNSKGAIVSDNEIISNGNAYIYGLIITGDNFKVSSNNITTVSDYYANGIDIEGPATGDVIGNNIDVKATNSAYGIYSGMNGKDVKANYKDNVVSGSAYNIFGMSIGDVDALIENTQISLTGNYTTGIAYGGSNITVKNNHIVLESSEVGNESISELFGVEAVGIKVIEGNADIVGNTIATAGKGVDLLTNKTSAKLEGNFINVVANEDKDAYAIYATESAELTIKNNTVDYQGTTKGTGINNAVYIADVDGAVISDNKFNLDLVSSYVPWAEVPEGSGNWVSSPVSEGIVVENSNNAIFDNNAVDVKFGDVVGSYDTIYSIDFKNSNNAVISNNNINSVGSGYIYGIIITGDNFTIKANNINSTGDYYVDGIDIEGPATGIVEDNGIIVKAKTSAYGIYSGMNGADVSAFYSGNDIVGDAYNVFGFSLGDVESNVTGNDVILTGNYTTGIAYRGSNLIVDNNKISAKGSNVGNESIGDSFGAQNIGIKVVNGTATITNNNIETTGDVAINLGNNTATVKDNYLSAKKAVGDSSVADATKAVISGNTPSYKIILAAAKIYTEYVDGVIYTVIAMDENGDPLSNITLFTNVNGNVYNQTTDADGYAAFVLDLDAGYYIAETSFEGNEKYGPKQITTPIYVDATAAIIKSADSSTVLLTAIKTGSYYKIVLIDTKENWLANKKVSITFNGKTQIFTTNVLGVINYKLTANKAGTQKLTIKFAGDNNYVGTTKTAIIKITKQATKVIAANKVFKVKVKVKKYAITLKDNKNKVIKKAKVTLRVNGKNYNAVTNAKGKAIFKITKLTKKATFTALIKFAGNGYYKASKKSVRILVR